MEVAAFSRAIDVPIMGETLRVIGREDFIAMKVFAGGPQDLNDAERAIVYCKNNFKVIDALNHAKKEIAKRPENITAQFAMAYSLFRNSRFTEAHEYMSKALRMNTKDAEMFVVASNIEQSLGNAQAASTLRSKALEIDPFADRISNSFANK